MDAPTDMPRPPTPSHPSSILAHAPFPMPSIHGAPMPCPSPGLSSPMPCLLHCASMSHHRSWPVSSPVCPLLMSICPCPGRMLKQDGCTYMTHAHSTHTL